jgi:large conductance mechanosensitive channel
MSKKLTKAERKELRKKKRQERREKGIGFVAEFKQFILRGNVIDMSVGVIVGSSFSKITSTLTNKIFMPWITYLLGDVSIEEIKTVLRPEVLDPNTGEVVVSEIALMWGEFFQVIIDFLLIAIVIFTTVKVINSVRVKLHNTREKIENFIHKDNEEVVVEEVVEEKVEEVVVEEVAPTPTSEDLLTEIRDLLKALATNKEE